MKKKKNRIVFIFLITLAILYCIIYIVPKITGAFVATSTVDYGELITADDATGYIVRDEQVFFAGDTGVPNYYIEDDELVRLGTRVMELKIEKKKKSKEGLKPDEKYESIIKLSGKDSIKTKDYTTNIDGLVSFYSDGREAKLNSENMADLSRQYYEKLTQDDVLSLRRDHIVKGEPVFKVVDRSKWYVVVYLDKHAAESYDELTYVTLRIGDEDIGATVVNKIEEGNQYKIIFKADKYFPDLCKARVVKLRIITDSTVGLIVDNRSITKKDGVTGVYVKNKVGDYKFVPINILAKTKEKSAVSKKSFIDEKGNYVLTIDTYDEILKNPK